MSKPPKIAEWLINRTGRSQEHFTVIGDMEEMFHEITRTRGTFKAALWYWQHVLRSVPTQIKYSLLRSLYMIQNYLKVAFRHLKNQLSYSLINISGMAIGLTCCVLILLYVNFERSYDEYHANADNMYRVYIDYTLNGNRSLIANSPGPIAPALSEAFPQIVDAVRFYPAYRFVIEHNTEKFFEHKFFFADPQVFKVFSFKLLQGDEESVLINPNSIVLTESSAQKYFGSDNPIGKTLIVERNLYTITGIMEDVPQNSHFTVDFLASFSTLSTNISNGWYRRNIVENWMGHSVYTYVVIAEGTDMEAFEEKLSGFIHENRPSLSGNLQIFSRIQPVTSIHLHSNLLAEIEANSSAAYTYILGAIAFLILVVACINFTNLSTARSFSRAKEVGLRKVMGAQKKQLIRQFLSESFLMAFLATGIAVILIKLFLPVFNNFSGKPLTFDLLQNLTLVVQMILLGSIAALIGGGYPAFFISSFQPVKALKGHKALKSNKSMLRTSLVTIQFSFSIILIISSMTIYDQLGYIRNKNLGFNHEFVINIPTRNRLLANQEKTNLLKSEFKKNPNVIDVTFTNVGVGNQNLSLPESNKSVSANMFRVDHDYVKTLGLTILEGRDFSTENSTDEKEAFLINETAAKEFGFLSSVVGKRIRWNPPWTDKNGTIIGIVSDFHFQSLHQKIGPGVIVIYRGSFENIMVKLSSNNVTETIAYLKTTWQQFEPDRPFEFTFLEDHLRQQYEAETKVGQIIASFSLLAVFIGCMGLFGLASYTAQHRTKEIGIRKVLGAKVSRIISLLSTEFGKLILLSNLIAWPLAYYITYRWLQGFAYRINPSMQTFFIGAGITIAVAFIAIGFQTVKAANTDPVKSLRQV